MEEKIGRQGKTEAVEVMLQGKVGGEQNLRDSWRKIVSLSELCPLSFCKKAKIISTLFFQAPNSFQMVS